MKKPLLFLLCLLTAVAVSQACYSQTKGATSVFGYSTSFVNSANDPDIMSGELYLGTGYNFNRRLSLAGQVELATHLFRYDSDARDYQTAATLGFVIGYNLIADGANVFQISAAVGNTMGGKDWQYLYFDGGLKWAMGRQQNRFFWGLGVRYYNSHQWGFHDFWSAYVTLGFKIN